MITVYCLSITLLTLLLEASFHWGADNSHTISVPSKGLRGLHIDLVMAEEQIPPQRVELVFTNKTYSISDFMFFG